ncbi:Uncharacterised protein [Chlamydia abortus]|nr:Uncharacterised protein [Chlamydia abortus]
MRFWKRRGLLPGSSKDNGQETLNRKVGIKRVTLVSAELVRLNIYIINN